LKRIGSILLLGILLFNWFGYRLLVSYMEDKNNSRLEAKLDNNEYVESDLISFKVSATHLSYYTNSRSFERVDGQVEISGISYKYVKRRLYNDSIELLCIPNVVTMQLRNAKDVFFKITNDLQNATQNRKSGSHSESKSFAFDCYFTLNNIPLCRDLFFSNLTRMDNYYLHSSSPYISQPDHPPRIS
jgi:hypothetical protein